MVTWSPCLTAASPEICPSRTTPWPPKPLATISILSFIVLPVLLILSTESQMCWENSGRELLASCQTPVRPDGVRLFLPQGCRVVLDPVGRCSPVSGSPGRGSRSWSGRDRACAPGRSPGSRMAFFTVSTATGPSMATCRARKVAPAPFRMCMTSMPSLMRLCSNMP